MGIANRLKKLVQQRPYTRHPAGRVLDVPSGDNVRELGGYDTPAGPTLRHRFLRSGTTSYLSDADVSYLLEYGVSAVVDLRSSFENPRATDHLAHLPNVSWLNVPLFDYDLSDPKLDEAKRQGNYIIDGYFTMLANRPAIRQIFEFFAAAPQDSCILFHCAAGMDRTGITAMLLLGLAGVDKAHIVADYTYSFDEVSVVDNFLAGNEVTGNPWVSLSARVDAIETVYDALIAGYATVYDYLLACEISNTDIERVRAHLICA